MSQRIAVILRSFGPYLLILPLIIIANCLESNPLSEEPLPSLHGTWVQLGTCPFWADSFTYVFDEESFSYDWNGCGGTLCDTISEDSLSCLAIDGFPRVWEGYWTLTTDSLFLYDIRGDFFPGGDMLYLATFTAESLWLQDTLGKKESFFRIK